MTEKQLEGKTVVVDYHPNRFSRAIVTQLMETGATLRILTGSSVAEDEFLVQLDPRTVLWNRADSELLKEDLGFACEGGVDCMIYDPHTTEVASLLQGGFEDRHVLARGIAEGIVPQTEILCGALPGVLRVGQQFAMVYLTAHPNLLGPEAMDGQKDEYGAQLITLSQQVSGLVIKTREANVAASSVDVSLRGQCRDTYPDVVDPALINVAELAYAVAATVVAQISDEL